MCNLVVYGQPILKLVSFQLVWNHIIKTFKNLNNQNGNHVTKCAPSFSTTGCSCPLSKLSETITVFYGGQRGCVLPAQRFVRDWADRWRLDDQVSAHLTFVGCFGRFSWTILSRRWMMRCLSWVSVRFAGTFDSILANFVWLITVTLGFAYGLVLCLFSLFKIPLKLCFVVMSTGYSMCWLESWIIVYEENAQSDSPSWAILINCKNNLIAIIEIIENTRQLQKKKTIIQPKH